MLYLFALAFRNTLLDTTENTVTISGVDQTRGHDLDGHAQRGEYAGGAD